MSEAEEIIRALALSPHPEGGHYRETFRDDEGLGSRGNSTAIYFLLRRAEESRWHRIDAAEMWHYYRGAPLELFIREHDGRPVRHLLGNDINAGQLPQILVPARAWQSARTLGAYTLAGCTVAPGFSFDGFELAPDDLARALSDATCPTAERLVR